MAALYARPARGSRRQRRIWTVDGGCPPPRAYGASPEERTGKIVITHVNGKFIKGTEDGHEFVENAYDADQYNDHAEASLAAAKLIAKAQAKLTRITTPEVEGAAV